MNETIIFIDAGFLSKLSKHFGNGKYLSYDLINLAKQLAEKQKLLLKHIFYYTAPPFQSGKPTKEEKQKKENYDKFMKKLSQNSIITMREGRCQRLKAPNGTYFYKQKGVDSLVVMDLMSVPLKHKQIKKIILVACDSDFVPIISDLQKLSTEVILYTYYDRNRNSKFATSNELIKSVSRYVLIEKADFDKASWKDS